MNYGKFAKPIGKAAGFGPFAIGPGFATFPGAGATTASGFQLAIPVSSVATTAGGKPFGKPWGI